MEGSLRTIPSPRTNTSVFAVPRSIARSSENCSVHRLNNITHPDSFQIYHVPRGGTSPAEPPAGVSGPDVERELERAAVRRQFRGRRAFCISNRCNEADERIGSAPAHLVLIERAYHVARNIPR